MMDIMILDDSPTQNAALATVLKSAGYRVATATSLSGALWQCREHRPRLALVELVLRRGNGYSRAAFLQRRTGVPVALMVSRQQPAEARWALARGLCGVVMRPRPVQATRQSVCRILQRLEQAAR